MSLMPPDPSANDRIKRSLDQEFVRMEDDFDSSRDKRAVIVDKLMGAVHSVKLVDDDGSPRGDIEDGVKVLTVALKAISDTEKAVSTAISLKLKNREQEIASNTAAKDRIQAIIRATTPGKIEEGFNEEDLGAKLDELFASTIQTYELKENPRDLSEV